MEKYKITPENHIQMLAKIRDQALAEKMYGVAGRMEELRGKATGLYIEKTMNLNKNEYDNLTEEELDQRMKQILEDYSGVLETKEEEKNND
jgi:site-specific recombinase XerC